MDKRGELNRCFVVLALLLFSAERERAERLVKLYGREKIQKS